MTNPLSPRELADLQLKYYNARDLDNFCMLFDDACQLVNQSTGDVILQGIDKIREMYRDRFSHPDIHCVVTQKMDLGDVAIDRETVSGVPDGPLEIIAIYQVKNSKFIKVSFVRV